jgi:hypothetical protein
MNSVRTNPTSSLPPGCGREVCAETNVQHTQPTWCYTARTVRVLVRRPKSTANTKPKTPKKGRTHQNVLCFYDSILAVTQDGLRQPSQPCGSFQSGCRLVRRHRIQYHRGANAGQPYTCGDQGQPSTGGEVNQRSRAHAGKVANQPRHRCTQPTRSELYSTMWGHTRACSLTLTCPSA